MFELVQFEHIDILPLELLVDIRHLLIEMFGVIQRRNCTLQFPLGLFALTLVDTIPPQWLQLHIATPEGNTGFGLLWGGWVLGVLKRLCGFVVAGLRFEMTGFENVLGDEGRDVLVPVGSTHEMYSLCPQFHL